MAHAAPKRNRRMRLGLLLVLLVPLPAFAKLEIRNVQPSHGPLGPARASDDVYPLDEYGVRYQVAGIKPDKDGKADLELSVKLTNAEGRAVYEVKPAGRKFDLTLGGDTVQAFGFVTFPEKATPGDYKLAVNVRDKTSGETAGFERKLTLKPPEFRIVGLRLS